MRSRIGLRKYLSKAWLASERHLPPVDVGHDGCALMVMYGLSEPETLRDREVRAHDGVKRRAARLAPRAPWTLPFESISNFLRKLRGASPAPRVAALRRLDGGID